MSDYLTRTARRVLNGLARGIVQLVADAGDVQRMQVKFSPLETIDNIPRCAEYGFVSNPPDGSDAVVIFSGGDRSNGVVIGTGNATYRMKQLASGEVAIHDSRGQSVYLTESGIKVDGGGNPVLFTNLTKLRVEAPIESTGDITDNVDTTGRSMSADRQIYDGHSHDVPNIQLGGSTRTSNPPNQPE
ncbi:phage baseplate assembly protein domain-containing protein [Paraburkholderia largidicola]|uniref:Bacteriophage Mu Gp45 N-terminal domain-containing protein n=1 Tax=Paraburkholderia largidicola TaxID=3014751 RepID=A0A7I8BJJ8_9BURK|nr:phage baseplate assembly protein [Paraburkholderia sp. PGU16]BCF88665.1 hypothetical protein PPGU16_17320 [Paraburkholderia sp. PGU16]